jgi:V8-like Glu-specific endopeptidase
MTDGTWAACSGTLISPTVSPTAAHCDLEVSRAIDRWDTATEATDSPCTHASTGGGRQQRPVVRTYRT